MSEVTKNYGFTLENDASTKFKEWREAINGTTKSNFLHLDEILFAKSDKCITVECVLLASAWSGTKAPYTQSITVSGLGATQDGAISLSQSATYAQREMARLATLCVTGQAAGSLTISADGDKPTADIPVTVTMLR